MVIQVPRLNSHGYDPSKRGEKVCSPNYKLHNQTYRSKVQITSKLKDQGMNRVSAAPRLCFKTL